MNDREIAYTLILGRPLGNFASACYTFHIYTGDAPPFERVYGSGEIGTMLDFVHQYVQQEIRYELQDNPFFWEGVSPEVAQIADPALRAFAHYALCGIVAPIYALDEAHYLSGILTDRPGDRFIIGWEAQPPLHDVAYCILERTGGHTP